MPTPLQITTHLIMPIKTQARFAFAHIYLHLMIKKTCNIIMITGSNVYKNICPKAKTNIVTYVYMYISSFDQ